MAARRDLPDLPAKLLRHVRGRDRDLAGIRERADYLAWLGIGAVWLSPIYRSPDADLGYDISDYLAVDPRLGTLEEFDALLAALHERGIRLVLDLVPSHTSDVRHGASTPRRHHRQVTRAGMPDQRELHSR